MLNRVVIVMRSFRFILQVRYLQDMGCLYPHVKKEKTGMTAGDQIGDWHRGGR